MSVKWGVLGTANIAKCCTIPGMMMADNCELFAVAGRSSSKAQNYALEIEQLGRVIENCEEQHITPEFSIRQAELLDQVLSRIGY